MGIPATFWDSLLIILYNQTINQMSKLKLNDIVKWRGAWGTQPSKDAKVIGIEINCVNKCGDATNEVNWSDVHDRTVIVSLEGGHWAYGNQIKPKQ